jgi:dolichol kinase
MGKGHSNFLVSLSIHICEVIVIFCICNSGILLTVFSHIHLFFILLYTIRIKNFNWNQTVKSALNRELNQILKKKYDGGSSNSGSRI